MTASTYTEASPATTDSQSFLLKRVASLSAALGVLAAG